MKTSVRFIPGCFDPAESDHGRVVVIDVLRASTSIITALANGAEGVLPFSAPEEARNRLADFPEGSALLCGERGGLRIPGFDLGNSPSEYHASAVRGKTLLFASTNGSVMLAKAQKAREVLVGGFVNRSAVLERIMGDRMDCTIACSGREGGFSLEDAVCSGMIVAGLMERSGEIVDPDDEALAAMALHARYGDDIEGMIRNSFHGRYLQSLGMGEDLGSCARLDTWDVVPLFREGALKAEKG